MADFILGMDAKIYQGTAAAALGSLTEMSNVSDVTLSLEAGEADITTRANSAGGARPPTLRECSVEFEMVWKPGDAGFDAGFDAVKAAFLASGTLELAVLDQDRATSGAQGPKGSFAITSFTRNEALEEAIKVSVTAKMSTFDEWVDVT